MPTGPLRVRREESELGRWEVVSYGPYQGYVEAMGAPVRRRELPMAEVVLILSLEEAPIRLTGPAGVQERRTSFVAGLDAAATVTEHDGRQLGIQVDLDPLTAGRLFGVPPTELANRAVALEDLLGRAGPELVERLHDLPGWEARFAVLDRELRRRLEAAPPTPPEVVHAWRRLRATGGAAPVGVLAAEVGWSRRHFGARFREHVGLPPKTVARVLRFRRAVARLDAGSPLADIAYACGYADQAHFSREARELAGVTPGALRAERGAPGEVAFVQDVAAAAA